MRQRLYSVMVSAMLAGVAIIGTHTAARAADMGTFHGGGTGSTPVEFGSGWYLRGDISYSFGAETNRTYYTDDRYEFTNNEFSHPFGYSIGAGYIFNNWFRSDLTFDQHTDQEWRGTSQGWACGTGECYGDSTADIKRSSLMLNGYVSLGNWSGITPYVGAGVGVTDVAWQDYSTDYYCYVDPGETCDHGAHSGSTPGRERINGTTQEGRSTSSLVPTYSLKAGLDYRISRNLLVDLGYSWTAMSGGTVIEKNSNGAGSPVEDAEFDFLNTHEVKIGLRYEVW